MSWNGVKVLITLSIIGFGGFIFGVNGGLSIKNDLVIRPIHEEVIRFVNDSYVVICSSYNGSKVRWLNPKGEVAPEGKGRVHTEIRPGAGAGAQALFFEQISTADRGDWACRSDTGADDKVVKMIIYEPISFAETPAQQTAREEADFTVKCIVKGDPTPTITWYFNESSVAGVPSNKYKKTDKGLYIKNVTLEDKGEYTCKAYQVSSSISNMKEQIIQLNIQHKPFAVKKLPHHAKAEEAYGYVSGTVNLTCEARAEPAANFTWHRNGKPVAKSSGRIFEDTHVSVLEVPIPDRSAFGDYMCKARNFMGTMERIITLIEGHRPEPPTEVILRGVNSDFVDIEIRSPSQHLGPSTLAPQPDNLPIIGYRFQYMPLPLPIRTNVTHTLKEPSTNDVIDDEVTTIAPVIEIDDELWKNASVLDMGVAEGTTYIISDLQHNTPYVIRVMSRNPAGLSVPSSILHCKTLRLQPYSVFGQGNPSAKSPEMLTIFFIASIIIFITSITQYIIIMPQIRAERDQQLKEKSKKNYNNSINDNKFCSTSNY